MNKERNDLFYVCSLIEHVARQTKNHREAVVRALGIDGIKRQLADAEVNHSLSFRQVGDELVERYGVPMGDFDTVSGCVYEVPAVTDIGKLYSIIILDCAEPEKRAEELMKVFSSFISDEISKFDTDVYYQNPSYLEESYKAGCLLA